MQRKFVVACVSLLALAIIFGFLPIAAQAQVSRVRSLVTERIDEAKVVTLHGNTRPEAASEFDRGALPYETRLEHMMLQLQRSPEQEKELRQYIDELETPGSPNYHKWLTPQEFGDRYGLAQQDLDAITGWLAGHGLTVNVVYPNRVLVDFSGTAGQVHEAFQTEIHSLEVDGVKHYANMGDPKIPAALSHAVAGVVSLHDFKPRTLYKMRPQYTVGSTEQLVAPADLATIYHLNPLFSASNSGQGQTVVVIEDTDVYAAADWATFRSTFGLSGYTAGSFSQVHPAPPSGTTNCTDPGVNADDGEATLDAEWASAGAPSAAIVLASCSDGATFGGLIALQNLLNESAGSRPSIVSISYGECEASNGAAANASYSSAYQQAVAESVSVFVSSGDEGAASCDANKANATHGIGISGFTSTIYNVSVGGTDFGDSFAGTNTTYWGSTNGTTFGSALSYIPEIPWNDSCASVLIATYVTGNSSEVTYGSSGFCNSTTAINDGLQTTASGSGGPSGCATGAATTTGVVSGTCAGYAKPSWQSLVGVPADSVRDIPDVSLFAANGIWGHAYVFCYSDPGANRGGAPCTGAPSGWSLAGGTSFASPIWAGFQALINQKAGGPQGNPNPEYYTLAKTEYGASGSTTCNSKLGNTVGSSCIFYDVTQGDMDVNCTGANSCYLPSGTYGVLSTSDSSYLKGYGTTTGWDFATGIGTVNVTNLANAWPASTTPNFSLSAAPSSVTITQGGAGGTSTITITPTDAFSGSVMLSASGLPTGVTAAFGTNPATTTSVLTLTASGTATIGTATVTITGTSGSLTHTTTVSLTVNAPPNFSLSANPSSVSISQGGASKTSTITIAGTAGFSGSVTLAATGLPTGVTAVFGTNPATTTSVVTFTASGSATTGPATVTITGTSGSLVHTTTISLSVTLPPNFTLSASSTKVEVFRMFHASVTITIAPVNGFNGNVSLVASGVPAGSVAAFETNPATSTSTMTFMEEGAVVSGTYPVTVTGTSGGLTHTVTFNVVLHW
ncbi:MAG: protease pro-enzyme activation domain-containing protein [Candidatus Acidiferrales bacterium]